MLFNSYIFVLVFLPIAVTIYRLLSKNGRASLSKLFLLAMSVWFYMAGEPLDMIVLAISILINFILCSLVTDNGKRSQGFRKGFLALGICLNVVSLLYFKYTGFLCVALNDIQKPEIPYDFKAVLAPLGISFFTFSQISFLVDTYREGSISDKLNLPADPEKGKKNTLTRLLDHALYISFFPKISIGPIATGKEIIPEFYKKAPDKEVFYDNLAKGLVLFTLGLSKKVLLADNLGEFVDWGYSNLHAVDTLIVFIMVIGYTLQIYFDFSGCCDMAMGVCRMFGMELPVNFDSPYKAVSLNEFWKRWHITLTSFFRKYVYFPLGGSRRGTFRTYLNIMIIFLISGLWHGANYTFLIWGALHGIGMCLSKALSGITVKLPRVIRFGITFIYLNLTWVFFRARTVSEALFVLHKLFEFQFFPMGRNAGYVATVTPVEFQLFQWLFSLQYPDLTKYTGLGIIFMIIIIAFVLATMVKNPVEQVRELKLTKGRLAGTIILLVWSIISLSNISVFIYNNF